MFLSFSFFSIPQPQFFISLPPFLVTSKSWSIFSIKVLVDPDILWILADSFSFFFVWGEITKFLVVLFCSSTYLLMCHFFITCYMNLSSCCLHSTVRTSTILLNSIDFLERATRGVNHLKIKYLVKGARTPKKWTLKDKQFNEGKSYPNPSNRFNCRIS